ncbi:glycoside hydrolase family protein [Fulvivirgaceae bacterium BMA12]|uniref:Glycoside hydrolase family protein n=1 Tax=Agaribacillus aureus TaxID=3051825 RepID=A0ABT8L6S3_9BACT|nr:glycoside hydrolase family protein [Fulvivirgaceae bacterium BMA12]
MKIANFCVTTFAVLLIPGLFLKCGTYTEKEDGSIGDFSALLKPVPKTSVLEADEYFIWGGSVVRGDDGLYHMFYSRWRRQHGFNAWVTHSEIAHAVSRQPGGPFQFKDVALPARGKAYWDGLTTHNPTIHKLNGEYFLYYMGTTGDGKATESLNFVHRNNQRIGVARAKNPNGPWQRLDQPLIDVSQDQEAYDALVTNNPSVTLMKDGKILLIYKAVARHHELPFGGPVTHLAAVSENPAGPFKKYKDPIFYIEGQKFPAEDPYIWYQKTEDQYYAIVKDMRGGFTNHANALAFFKSKNGLDWKPAENALVSKTEIHWVGGAVDDVHRLERPQLLIENGRPAMLYCAVAYGDPFQGSATANVHIPLDQFGNKE